MTIVETLLALKLKAARILSPVVPDISQTCIPGGVEKRTFIYRTGLADEEFLADVHWSVAPSKSTFDLSAPRPTAIVLHAGGFVVGGDKDLVPRATVPHLTSLGFIVVVPNYHPCPQISDYDGPRQDCRDTLFWTRNVLTGLLLNTVPREERVSVDTSRIVTVGCSAGGTLALLLGTGYRPVAAVMDIYGGEDLVDPLSSKGCLPRPATPEECAHPGPLLGQQPVCSPGS
ncbi:hypothetical protein HKX48_001158 [Thoreauomyces humboldtii]|nr:hypothetical protein HKX48_001158 [Thoreauomyces humboldtii]